MLRTIQRDLGPERDRGDERYFARRLWGIEAQLVSCLVSLPTSISILFGCTSAAKGIENSSTPLSYRALISSVFRPLPRLTRWVKSP